MTIIGLNFFTTIILDAYSQARDARAADTQLELMGDELCCSLMSVIGLEPETCLASPRPSSTPATPDTSEALSQSEDELQESLVPPVQHGPYSEM